MALISDRTSALDETRLGILRKLRKAPEGSYSIKEIPTYPYRASESQGGKSYIYRIEKKNTHIDDKGEHISSITFETTDKKESRKFLKHISKEE